MPSFCLDLIQNGVAADVTEKPSYCPERGGVARRRRVIGSRQEHLPSGANDVTNTFQEKAVEARAARSSPSWRGRVESQPPSLGNRPLMTDDR